MKKFILFFVALGLLSCNSKETLKTMLLQTSGYIEFVPNEASLEITISYTNKDILRAKDNLIKKSHSLFETLKNANIHEEDIITTGVHLRKDYTWQNRSQVFIGYEASTSTHIKVRDLKILDHLYPKLLSNVSYSLGGLKFQHSKIDSLSQLAYLQALENANQLADNILQKLPEDNKNIIRISNVDISETNYGTYKEKGYSLAVAAPPPPPAKMEIQQGKMKVIRQIFVVYEIQ